MGTRSLYYNSKGEALWALRSLATELCEQYRLPYGVACCCLKQTGQVWALAVIMDCDRSDVPEELSDMLMFRGKAVDIKFNPARAIGAPSRVLYYACNGFDSFEGLAVLHDYASAVAWLKAQTSNTDVALWEREGLKVRLIAVRTGDGRFIEVTPERG